MPIAFITDNSRRYRFLLFLLFYFKQKLDGDEAYYSRASLQPLSLCHVFISAHLKSHSSHQHSVFIYLFTFIFYFFASRNSQRLRRRFVSDDPLTQLIDRRASETIRGVSRQTDAH